VHGSRAAGVALVAVFSGLGCGPQSSLAALGKPQLALSLHDTARVTVIPGDAILGRGDCALLAPQTRATLNDVPLVRLRGVQTSDDFAYNRDCLVELAVPLSAVPRTDPGARLRLWDDSTSWLFEVPTAFAQRAFTFVDPSQAVAKRGDEIELFWSTPSDTLDPSLVAFELLRAEDKPGEGTAIREPDISGALVAFELPAATTGQAWSGPARLRFLGTQGVEPMHPACPVDTCSVDLAFEVPTLPLTLED
jgi:hypothetical protein